MLEDYYAYISMSSFMLSLVEVVFRFYKFLIAKKPFVDDDR